MSKLPTRKLGQGLELSAIGLGCMGLTEFYGADTKLADPSKIIHHAIDCGVTYFDTSDAYGPFRNEEALGAALVGKRDQVTISSKFGVERKSGEGAGTSGETVRINGRPDYVRSACEASLKRLRTDRIDLYIQHRMDETVPIEETVGAMADLVREGKIGYIALCEVGADTIRRAHAEHPLSAVHSEYSLWSRDPEDQVFSVLDELEMGFIPYSPLGRGFLTGKIKTPEDLAEDDWRRHSPRFQGENFYKNLELVAEIEKLAGELNVSTAQLALAWVLNMGERIVPVQGATNTRELDENVQASTIKLSETVLARIDSIAPKGAAHGAAWPEGSAGSRSVQKEA